MSTIRWLIIPITLLLSGCGSDEFQDLQDFVKNSGADMRGKIEAPPEVKPYEPFNYNNSENLPDPFRPRKPAQPNANSTSANQPEEHHKEELEEFPLDSLKMVGFVYIHNTANAVILSPDLKLHHVKVGNFIGQNFGKITSVTETEVQILEKVQDSSSDWSDRASSLQLIE